MRYFDRNIKEIKELTKEQQMDFGDDISEMSFIVFAN